jgi:hypothetical protein
MEDAPCGSTQLTAVQARRLHEEGDCDLCHEEIEK